MDLFFVEVLHFVGCYYLIIIQIYHFEPIAYAPVSRLIFFTEHKPNEIFVIHFIFFVAVEFSWNLIEYSVNGFSAQSVAFISGEIFFVNQEIVICVELPESAIQNIEMLIGKILANYVDVAFIAYLHEGVHQIGILEITPSYFSVIV